MDGREFSLLLPEGRQVACKSPMSSSAVKQAITANDSRASRGVALAKLLHRPTGRVFDVPPGSRLTQIWTQIHEALGQPAPL